MRNPPVDYKNTGYDEFGKSGDGALLAKKRQNFAAGGYAKWLGAGPESYPAMRAEMSPSDFATFRKNVSPEEYNRFMGVSSPAATPAANYAPTSSNKSVNDVKQMVSDLQLDAPTKSAIANRPAPPTLPITTPTLQTPYAKGGLVKKGGK
jgi:hypothetical protein